MLVKFYLKVMLISEPDCQRSFSLITSFIRHRQIKHNSCLQRGLEHDASQPHLFFDINSGESDINCESDIVTSSTVPRHIVSSAHSLAQTTDSPYWPKILYIVGIKCEKTIAT